MKGCRGTKKTAEFQNFSSWFLNLSSFFAFPLSSCTPPKMASMGWMLRRLSLLVLLIWVLDVEAEMIHNSCRDMKQYREDGTLETIGNVYPMVDQALNEAFQMTGYAKDTMLDVEEHKASNEVASNVIGVFTGLQGDHQRPVRSGPWNYLYGKTLIIFPPVVSFMLKCCLLPFKTRSSTSKEPLKTGLESHL